MTNILFVAALFVLAAEAIPLSKTSHKEQLDKGSLLSRREIAAKLRQVLEDLRTKESDDMAPQPISHDSNARKSDSIQSSIPEIEFLKDILKARNAKRTTQRKTQTISKRRCYGGIWLCTDNDQAKEEEKEDSRKREMERQQQEAAADSKQDCRPGMWYCRKKDQSQMPPPVDGNRILSRLRSLDRSQAVDQADRLKMKPLTKIDDDADWMRKILESTER